MNMMEYLFGPAMEAPTDITKTTDTMMKSIGGNNPDSGDLDPDVTSDSSKAADGDNIDNRGDINTNTNNILNTPDAPEPHQEEELTETDGTPMEDNPDETGDDMGDTDNQNDGAMNQDNMGTPEEPITPEQIQSLKKLRENMNLFYNNLCSNIELLGDYSPNSIVPEAQEIYFKIISHFNECKKQLFTILTTEFTITEYPDLLKKYIAIRHVYYICLNMLNSHFEILDIATSKSS